mmetsp:Transcript_19044/g.67251  ORF Transcript_19044/g.67251 Transcript_19044/m.67251 type:complete len:544 (-) Transcript_19044:58-1689(-)
MAAAASGAGAGGGAGEATGGAGDGAEGRRRSVTELVSLFETSQNAAAAPTARRGVGGRGASVPTQSLLKLPDVTIYHMHRPEVTDGAGGGGGAAGGASGGGGTVVEADTDAASAPAAGGAAVVERRAAASGVLRCLTVADPESSGSLTFLMVGAGFAFPLVRAPALRANARSFVLMTADSSVTWGLVVGAGATDDEAAELELLLATHCQLFDMHTHDLLEVAEVDGDGNVVMPDASGADAAGTDAAATRGGSEADAGSGDGGAGATGGKDGGGSGGAGDGSGGGGSAARATTAGTLSTTTAPGGAGASDGALVPAGGEEEVGLAAAAATAIDATGRALAASVVLGAEWVGYGVRASGSWLTSYLAPVGEGEEVAVDETTQSYLDTARQATGAAVTITAGLLEGVSSLAMSVGSAVATAFGETSWGKSLAGTVDSETGRAVTTVAVSSVVALGTVLEGLEVAAVSLLDATADTTATVVTHKYGAQAGRAAASGADVGRNLARAGVNVRRMGARALVRRTVTGVAADRMARPAVPPPPPSAALTS